MAEINKNKPKVSKEDESILIAEIIDIVMNDVELRPSDEAPIPGMKKEHYCSVVDLSKTMKNVRSKVDEILKLRNS